MKFGRFELERAQGGILAHSVKLSTGKTLRKGQIIGEEQLEMLRGDGVNEVHAAILEPGDVDEDEAAARIAAKFTHSSLVLETASTGRVNIHAAHDGLFSVSADAVDAINALDPGVTLATLANRKIVRAGRLVASLKIIPYALEKSVVERCEALDFATAMQVRLFGAKRVALVQSQLAGTKPSVLDKTRRTLAKRLEATGSQITAELRVEHSRAAIAEAVSQLANGADMVVVFGASAISDIRDEIPAAIESLGGEIIRFGMPVDPGNLLLLATLDGMPVIGAPGCARGPAENGFDWVLQQLLAGIAPATIEIAGMGVGGLLMESVARPHPRQSIEAEGRKVGIVLAAGMSRRMGAANKMTKQLNGKALVRHVVESAIGSGLDEVVVVTGHEPEIVRPELEGLPITFVHNSDFQEGLSTSIAAGIGALPENVSHAMILLGDMPFVDAPAIDAMLACSDENPRHIVLASSNGRRGNPVLWPSSYFPELTQLSGDIGAKHLIARYRDDVVDVEIGDAAAIDLDTPEAVAAAQNNGSDN